MAASTGSCSPSELASAASARTCAASKSGIGRTVVTVGSLRVSMPVLSAHEIMVAASSTAAPERIVGVRSLSIPLGSTIHKSDGVPAVATCRLLLPLAGALFTVIENEYSVPQSSVGRFGAVNRNTPGCAGAPGHAVRADDDASTGRWPRKRPVHWKSLLWMTRDLTRRPIA